jgi:hypothetical protein
VYFFFFEKFLILRLEELKYWRSRQIPRFSGFQKFCRSCQIWLVADISKKKYTPQISWSITKKIFSPIGLKTAEKKGGFWFLTPKKLVSRKMQNKKNL